MQSFTWKDPHGRFHQFQISIDPLAAIRVKQATGLAIESLVQPQHVEKWDRAALYLALHAIIQPSRQGVTDDMFVLALSDGDVAEAATKALQEAVIDFLPQQQRSLLRSMLARGETVQTQRMEMAPILFEQIMVEQEKQMMDLKSRLSSSTSAALPESPQPG